MHRSGLGGLIIDCRTDDLDGEAQFWSKALGYEIRPSDDPDDENYVVLDTREGEPYIELQTVEHPSRVHLDIKTDDLEAEVRRLEQLGATRVKKVKHWWVLEAPSGQRFCVIPLHPGQDIGRLNRWDGDAWNSPANRLRNEEVRDVRKDPFGCGTAHVAGARMAFSADGQARH